MEKALSMLGLLSPFYIAGAAYGFFSWCETHASDDALSAFSRWLRNKPYKAMDVRDALKHIFDCIYSSPLLSVKAFCRSMMISGFVWLIMCVYAASYFIVINGGVNHVAWDTFAIVNIPILIPLIISDYCSLFGINKALTSSKRKPAATLAIAFLRALIIVMCYAVLFVVIMRGAERIFGSGSVDTTELTKALIESGISVQLFELIMEVINFVMIGMITNIWLILFLIGLIGYRILTCIFDMAGYMQWFLKHGEEHPFQALGAVSATGTFVVLSLGRIF